MAMKRPAAVSGFAKIATKQQKVAKAPPAVQKPTGNPLVLAVQDGLDETTIPSGAREMLLSVLKSLSTDKPVHGDESSAKFWKLIEETFAEHHTSLEEYGQTCQTKYDELQALKEQDVNAVAAVTKALSDHQALMQTSKLRLAEVATAFQKAASAVAEAEANGASEEAAMATLAQDQERLEGVMSDVKNLLEGSAKTAEPDWAKTRVGVVTEILTKAKLDVTMLDAFANAVLKEPDTRGTFDAMVINKVQEDIITLKAEWSAKMQTFKAAASTRSVQLQTIRNTVAAPKKQQLEAATAFQALRDEEAKRSAAVAEAKKASADRARSMREAMVEFDRAGRDLRNFTSGPEDALAKLRASMQAAPEEPIVADGDVVMAATENATPVSNSKVEPSVVASPPVEVGGC